MTAEVSETTPGVTGVCPCDDRKDVNLHTHIVVTFSTAVNVGTVTGETFTLHNADTDQPVQSEITARNGGKKGLLKPTRKLDTSTRYIAAIKGGHSGVKDDYGRPVQGKTWSFQTEHAKVSPWAIRLFVLVLLLTTGGSATMVLFDPVLAGKAVIVRQDLQPYTVVSPTDIFTTTTILPPDRAVTETEAAVGRVTKGPLRHGTILTYSRLVELPKGTTVSNDWQLLSVPYPSTTISPPAGQRVKLLGVRADSDKPEVVSNRAIIRVKADKQLVVALPPNEVDRAAWYLAGSGFSTSSPSGDATNQRSLQVVLDAEDGQIRTR